MKYLSISCEYTKHLLLIILLLVAAKALAQDIGEASQVMSIETQTCPDKFFQIEMPKGGKLCQIFATDLPASIVFYVPQPVQSVIDFYQNNPQFKPAVQILQRFMIQSKDNNSTIIVSADGVGTQVDVLVKEDYDL